MIALCHLAKSNLKKKKKKTNKHTNKQQTTNSELGIIMCVMYLKTVKIICFFSFDQQARVSCSWEETWNVQKTISSFGKQVTVTHWRAKTSDCYVSPQMKPSNTTDTRESESYQQLLPNSL